MSAGPVAPPAPPGMDPRIRDRRVRVRREEGRRRLRLLVGGAAAMAMVAAGWGVTRSPLMDVDRVVVRGSEMTPAAAVVAASRVERGRAMTAVRERAVAARVARLPWVARARVSRHWPGTVRVVVTERRPAAWVRATRSAPKGRPWLLVDRTGRVLTRATGTLPGLPVVQGTRSHARPGAVVEEPVAGALRVAGAVPPARRERVAAVDVRADGTIDLRVRTGSRSGTVVVRVGDAGRAKEKVAAALTVLDQATVRPEAVLDVRVPSAPVLTPRPS